MGLIIDTGLLIRAERDGLTPAEALELWSRVLMDEELGLSVVTLAEFAHGLPRAPSERRRAERLGFIEGLRRALPVYPVDGDIAMRAGVIDGELREAGITIGLGDALISATALLQGDGVVTFNVRHFREVRDLRVVEL